MPLISCLLCTARDDHPIIGLPGIHLFEPTLRSLTKQTFTDFELIIVDALHEHRSCHDFSQLTFPVKHVPPHPNHRFWLDRKRWGVCGMLNTGILHSEGELLVRIDDCSEFDEGYLQRVWDEYERGYWLMAMHTRYRGGRQAYYNEEYRQSGYDFVREEPDRRRILDKVYGEGDPVRDTRWLIVERNGGRMIGPPQWFYGYSCLPLEAALRVNGFNELMDADKGQEDQECGLRLSMAGYRDVFLLDVRHQVIEHEHLPIPDSVISHGQGNIKCNYAVYLLNQRKGRWRANSEGLTSEELAFVREESLRPPCSPHPDFYLDDCHGELFRLWAENPPIFDLREERLEV